MSPRSRLVCRLSVFACALPVAIAQADDASRFVGEVTVPKLMVRSGPSLNYYVVATLAAGDRVTVRRQDNGWYAIVPTAECYSLISKDYVDIEADGKSGVVTGDNVRVRAGSDIDNKKYAVQDKLDKGAEIRILGDDGEGFYKIVPPEEAVVWVHSDYVVRVPEERLNPVERQPVNAGEAVAVPPKPQVVAESQDGFPALPPAAPGSRLVDDNPAPGDRGDTEMAESEDVRRFPSHGVQNVAIHNSGEDAIDVRTVTAERESDVADSERSTAGGEAQATAEAVAPRLSASEYRNRLKTLERDFATEAEKPVAQRDLARFLKEYRELAAQGVDTYSQLYAKRRLEQIEAVTDATDALRKIREMAEDVTTVRSDALQARSRLRRFHADIERGFDAKGELRESMIYSSPVGPRRYRLIDPDSETPRTLCYVEIPEDSGIDVAEYLGSIVGVRARETFLQPGRVDPIAIVVADKLVRLDASSAADGVDTNDESTAEPQFGPTLATSEVGPPVDMAADRE